IPGSLTGGSHGDDEVHTRRDLRTTAITPVPANPATPGFESSDHRARGRHDRNHRFLRKPFDENIGVAAGVVRRIRVNEEIRNFDYRLDSLALRRDESASRHHVNATTHWFNAECHDDVRR